MPNFAWLSKKPKMATLNQNISLLPINY